MGKLTDLEKIKIIESYQRGVSSNALAKLYLVSPPSILSILKRRNIDRRKSKKYTLDINCFDDMCPNVAYWIGFLLADGNVSDHNVRLELSNKDRDHLTKFADFCKSEHPIKNTTKNCSSIRICSTELVRKLNNLGMTKRKTLTVSTPNKLDVNLLSHFYRGYFDGDGWFTCRNKNGKIINWEIGFSSGSEKMINEIHTWIQKQLDRKCGYLIHRQRNNGSVYQLTYGGNFLVKAIINVLYNDADTYLNRKHEKSRTILDYINLTYQK